MSETIMSGGIEYEAAWIPCTVLHTKKRDEVLVRIDAAKNVVEAPSFFVEPSVVEVKREPQPDETVQGRVKVILFERRDEAWVVEIPGEPVTYGPKLVVSVSA